MKHLVGYAVIDDYGDNWEEGAIVFSSESLFETFTWAENENYHSASLVKLFEDGSRKLVDIHSENFDKFFGNT